MSAPRRLLTLLALAVSWVGLRPAEAVVGPSTSGQAAAPFVVMVLQRQGAAAGFCSGIVISRSAVLTAAHCVPPGADLRIHFRDAEGAPVLLPVGAVVRHPEYRADAIRRRQKSIDLAVVTLPNPLPDRFVPVRIDDPGPVAVGTPFRLVGFGVTRERDGASSGRLREAALAARAPLSAVLLWAEDPDHHGLGACTGDSGGPVFRSSDDTVVALTLWSSGSGSAHCGSVTQALWLAPFRAWIRGAAPP